MPSLCLPVKITSKPEKMLYDIFIIKNYTPKGLYIMPRLEQIVAHIANQSASENNLGQDALKPKTCAAMRTQKEPQPPL